MLAQMEWWGARRTVTDGGGLEIFTWGLTPISRASRLAFTEVDADFWARLLFPFPPRSFSARSDWRTVRNLRMVELLEFLE